MKIRTVRSVCFSPTGTSRKIVEAIASGFSQIEAGEFVDLTYPDSSPSVAFQADELVVIGVPVYAGRVAALAAKRLQNLRGTGGPAIFVVLYGNREFEDALVELHDLVFERGFQPLAGGAFIGEHSFSSSSLPIGMGRPDGEDLTFAAAFGGKIATILEQGTADKQARVDLPGNIPYKEKMGSLPFTPAFDLEICTRCGLCIDTCPSGAISIGDELDVDSQLCIFCCACLKNCPEEAVTIAAPPLKEKAVWLHEHCRERKVPQVFVCGK